MTKPLATRGRTIHWVTLLAAVAPFIAQEFGADHLGLLRQSLRIGLWTAFLLSLPMMGFVVSA
ncbi:MATE family efflux transporter [Bradyrhizobium sp. LA7.1]|uniref:MATE family efflux transporter n=1 Tax=Bradyrhizobium sp. LA7.1 TaxID=3156324 RepID=UPI003392C457